MGADAKPGGLSPPLIGGRKVQIGKGLSGDLMVFRELAQVDVMDRLAEIPLIVVLGESVQHRQQLLGLDLFRERRTQMPPGSLQVERLSRSGLQQPPTRELLAVRQ